MTLEAPKVKELDDYLNEVDYSVLNSPDFMPSEFALSFMNFIKLVNGDGGESNVTPPVHLAMLEKVESRKGYIANLLFRGSGKTALMAEYMFLYIATFGFLPNFGKVSGAIYISDTMGNGVKSLRMNVEYRYENSEFLQHWIPKAIFTDPYLEFQNREGHRFGLKMFGALTGLRGTKIFGKRPVLAVLDDLVSDETARSPTSMQGIKDTIYKGVNHALDPTRRKIILNGTPFSKEDILIEAVESGAWDVNVYPVCEKFPCSKEEFVGAWEDRFSYEFIKDQYGVAVATGKLSAFYQELMLRISTEDERLVQDGDIRWYRRPSLLEKQGQYNFYITTDFATSDKQTADDSVIFVWAYNSNGDWFWVDGVVAKQTMDKNINDLFRLVQQYKPQQVGVETSGQQKAFIQWLQQEQMNRNVWFSFASSEKSGEPGIRPITNKLSRFNLVVPWFKAGKFYFPVEMKDSLIIGKIMGQISLVTDSGIKGKDDCIDGISMLGFFKPWKPSDAAPLSQSNSGIWEEDEPEETDSALSSYIV